MLESGPAAAALNVWQKKVTVSKRLPNASRNPHSTPALFTPPHERSLLSASIQCREMIFHFGKIRIKVYQAKCVVTLLQTHGRTQMPHTVEQITPWVLEAAFSVSSRRRLFVLVPCEWHCKSHVNAKPFVWPEFLSRSPLSVMNFCSDLSFLGGHAERELFENLKGSFSKTFNFLPPLLLYIWTPLPFLFVFHPFLLCQEWTHVIKPLTRR